MAVATVPTAISAARKIQIGIETTPGAEVNATRRILTRSAEFHIIEETEPFENQMHGTLSRVAQAPRATRRGMEFTFTSDLDYQQVLMPILSGLEGGVSSATPGAGEARTWTFAPSPTVDPQPDTYTIEWAERNLDTVPDELEYQSLYCFCKSMEITGEAGGGVPQLSFTMEGRRAKAGTATTSLAIPTLSPAVNGNWYFYLNDTWAAMGDTKMDVMVYGFTWRLETGLSAGYYLDGRADLDFNQYQYGIRFADLTMDLVIDPTAAGVVPVEIEKKGDRLGTTDEGQMRFIRFENYGKVFAGVDSGLERTLRIDGAYFHASDSMERLGEDRNGNAIIRWHLMSAYDKTNTSDIEIYVQNNADTFP